MQGTEYINIYQGTHNPHLLKRILRLIAKMKLNLKHIQTNLYVSLLHMQDLKKSLNIIYNLNNCLLILLLQSKNLKINNHCKAAHCWHLGQITSNIAFLFNTTQENLKEKKNPNLNLSLEQ